MKVLIVYYSWTGNNKKLANEIKTKLKADVEEIIDTAKRQGDWGYFLNGMHTMLKHLTNIEPVKKNPTAYDLVAICTPLWVSSFPPATRTYLLKNKSKFNKVALVSISGRGELNKNVEKQFEEIIGKKAKTFLLLTETEFKSSSYKNKLGVFIKEVLQK
jgi:flavodoxin